MAAVKLKRILAVAVGKTVRTGIRRLGRGGGTTLPGFLAQKIDTTLVSDLVADIPCGVILVSGTNGKTTTCRMIAAILSTAGFTLIHNHEGSNLHQGLATTLLAHTDPLGRLKVTEQTIGLLELDEGVFPQVLNPIHPRVVLLTNIFRDQLDRYFELDYLAELWRRGLKKLPPETVLVLNADDPLVASLSSDVSNPIVFYGLEDSARGHSQLEHASDTRRCPYCSADLVYTLSFYAHLGHYHCPNCGWARPQPQLQGRRVALEGVESSQVEMAAPAGMVVVRLPLPGLFNAYNVLNATAVALALGLPLDIVAEALATLRPAFGRLEQLIIDGHPVYLILVKNPSGFNEVLRLLQADCRAKNLLLALNDNVPDGRDVSWIWDVDFELLRGQVRFVVASGLRAHDLALRLKHAEWFLGAAEASVPELLVERDVLRALDLALVRTPNGEPLYIIPTYTAMWELREGLRKAGYVKPLWQETVQEHTR
jgi:UDP-N-acetylmuramyl tripeptide synthase